MAKSVNLSTPGAADGKGSEDGVHFARLDGERPLRDLRRELIGSVK